MSCRVSKSSAFCRSATLSSVGTGTSTFITWSRSLKQVAPGRTRCFRGSSRRRTCQQKRVGQWPERACSPHWGSASGLFAVLLFGLNIDEILLLSVLVEPQKLIVMTKSNADRWDFASLRNVKSNTHFRNMCVRFSVWHLQLIKKGHLGLASAFVTELRRCLSCQLAQFYWLQHKCSWIVRLILNTSLHPVQLRTTWAQSCWFSLSYECATCKPANASKRPRLCLKAAWRTAKQGSICTSAKPTWPVCTKAHYTSIFTKR